MRPVIRWSLHERRGGIIGWSAGIGAYIALNILVYGSIRGQAQVLNQALQNLPPTAKALFGGGNSDFLSPVGYLNSKLYYLILPLLFTMLAIGLSNKLLGREEEAGTLELLLARPLSRGRILLAKLVAGLGVMLAVGGTSLLVTVACAKAVNYDIPVHRIAEATALSLLLSLLFGAVAWALLGIGRFGRRASMAGAGVIALAGYLFSSLEDSAHWLRWPAKLLPYHYYDPAAVLHGNYDWWNAAGFALATLILMFIAFVGFRRRDLA